MRGIGDAVKNMRGKGRITEANIQDGLKQVRTALLEADVNFNVANEFIERVKTLVPERAKQLDERGVRAFPEIVVELEERLIAELRAGTEGRETDPQDAALRLLLRRVPD